MIAFNRIRLALVLAFVSVFVVGVIWPTGAQTTHVEGKVMLKQADGTAAPAKPFSSGETVETAKGSSAVVSLGKLGRVEVFEESKMTLNYNDDSATALLDAGRVRVSSASGVASVTTDDAEVVAIDKRPHEFTVDVRCGDTLVASKKGTVELRAGSTVKQIAAGSQDTAGTATPGCSR